MGVPVTLFNTSSLTVQVSVNNGATFAIPAASAQDGSPASAPSGGPSFAYGNPAPNVLAPGSNRITLSVQGGSPQQLQVMLSGGAQWNALQLYFFFNYGGAGYVALNAGQFVAGSLPQ
jgi:hypothetical protein